jgi:Flp pilus assembly protein TadG
MTLKTVDQTKRSALPACRRFLRRFSKDKSAATAVEFALVATPFFFMLLGITEMTTSYFASVQLENAMETVARQIRTGEVQAANMNQAQFTNLLCNAAAPIIPCDANLVVDVRVFQNFGGVQNDPPILPNGAPNPAFQLTYNPGTAGDIVLARAFYIWQFHTPMLGTLLSNIGGSNRLLQSSAVFRNEPWQPAGG